MNALLNVDDLKMQFGGLIVLDGVSFNVREKEILSIIGPNGAGKTTLFNILSGIYRATGGTIRLADEPIGGLKMHTVARKGVGRTFQNVRLFGNMSVLENVMVGRHCRTQCGLLQALFRVGGARREERVIREKAMEELAFVDLEDRAFLPSASLPFGKQRMLEIARTLASQPRILLLDEPAAGLNPRETEDLSRIILKIRDRGITVLLVEHDMDLVMDISDRIVVLHNGTTICEGPPREIQDHPEVISAYLGEGF
jgi:branched-chain amino acid transport system ATP-binding protein